MCDVQVKLIAWLDRELPKDEAIAVERHIESCRECHRWVTSYGQVSETFEAYCDELMAGKTSGHVPRWVPVLAAAVVATVILLTVPRTRVERPPVGPPITAASVSTAPALRSDPTLRRMPVRRRPKSPLVQEHTATGQPMDTAIEIAIPAEAMFAPGTVPKGISLIADLRIAPDGSVRLVHLRQ